MSLFKIVSDFDGVWTNQAGEAASIRQRLLNELSDLTSRSAAELKADVDQAIDHMHSEPGAHGWAPQGRITAFVDEDPLCNVNAFCVLLGRPEAAELIYMKEAVLGAGFETLDDFSEHCFRHGMKDYRDDHPPCIVPHAKEVLGALHDAGADIVVVSNSESEKLIDYFQAAGIDAGEGEGSHLRVRGSAAKWHLGTQPEVIEVSGRQVFVDRPRYRMTLSEERPDLVIGDVFSLDLSLPHSMRTRGEPFAPKHLALRKHAHTPRWAWEGRAGGAIDHVVEDLMELVDVVKAAR